MQTADTSEKRPTHEVVYQRLREKVLFGELAPGQAVTIQGLVETLGVGMTPVREAIRRMISEGALVFQGNRRVSVPSLSPDDIDQMVFIRKSIECELANRAASNISDAGVNRLAEIDAALDKALLAEDIHNYLVHNYQFHAELYRHANAPVLTDIAERVWLRFGPSMRVVCGQLDAGNFPDRHKDILEAMRRRDGELAALAMERDVKQGMEQIRHGLSREVDSIDKE
ncbi:GntR family transcriptional regulator [Epibacterium ulvae]|uniref:GntR family transcriptional regulator n=1 Tax=Epibacterium ulvae TaxID=1156985 RepID=UPI001BFC7340|nr:GntR family transcriptional regulator [Epibacterium ulvae]MBT8153209.1 GntR family transcriptional regulator [Epibacterium ulvae]